MLWHLGAHVLDARNRVLRADGREVPVEPKVLELLELLARAEGGFVATEALRASLWPRETVGPEALRRLVRGARRALESGAAATVGIRNERARGYRLVGPVTRKQRPGPGEAAPQGGGGGFFLVRTQHDSTLESAAHAGGTFTRAPAVDFGPCAEAFAWRPLLVWLEGRAVATTEIRSAAQLWEGRWLARQLREALGRGGILLRCEQTERAHVDDLLTLESLLPLTGTAPLRVWVGYRDTAVEVGSPASEFLARVCARDGVTEVAGQSDTLQRLREVLKVL